MTPATHISHTVKISVCIASVRAATIAAAVRSICLQTFSEWELIVVGQGDRDEGEHAVLEAARHDPRVRFIHLAERGLSRARNAGLAAASSDIIAMTDDDCEAQADWLDVLWQAFQDHPKVGLVGGALLAPKATSRFFSACPENVILEEAIYDPKLPPPDCDWVGGNFALRRSAIEQVGLFDEHLGAGSPFPAAEDTDYKLRMEALGIHMLLTPRSVVKHTHGCRNGLRAMLAFQKAYATGNGAMAAKLTLQSDARSIGSHADTHIEWLKQVLHAKSLHRLLINLRRLHFYNVAYRNCLRGYVVDTKRNVLTPRFPI